LWKKKKNGPRNWRNGVPLVGAIKRGKAIFVRTKMCKREFRGTQWGKKKEVGQGHWSENNEREEKEGGVGVPAHIRGGVLVGSLVRNDEKKKEVGEKRGGERYQRAQSKTPDSAATRLRQGGGETFRLLHTGETMGGRKKEGMNPLGTSSHSRGRRVLEKVTSATASKVEKGGGRKSSVYFLSAHRGGKRWLMMVLCIRIKRGKIAEGCHNQHNTTSGKGWNKRQKKSTSDH